jgi:hypothetical protein
LISVRSEVQVFPGPPHSGVSDQQMVSDPVFPDSGEGAIAQLGERLLCKQEVVGSIPSGSTSGSCSLAAYASLPEFSRTMSDMTCPAGLPRFVQNLKPIRASRSYALVVRVFCHREEEIDPNFVHGLCLLAQAADEVPTPGIRMYER